MYQAAFKAYDSVNKSTMSGRDVEAAVLTKAALRLKACQDNWSLNGSDANLEAALKYNQRVWCIFQAELENPKNPLPSDLKANLFQLIAFIDKRTLGTIAYPAPEKLTILININHNIAAGLRTRQNPVESGKAAA